MGEIIEQIEAEDVEGGIREWAPLLTEWILSQMPERGFSREELMEDLHEEEAMPVQDTPGVWRFSLALDEDEVMEAWIVESLSERARSPDDALGEGNAIADFFTARAMPIPLADAVQLVLWFYCVTDLHPKGIAPECFTRKGITEAFAVLSQRGWITNAEAEGDEPQYPAFWDAKIKGLLLNRVPMDRAFAERAGRYVG